MENKAAENRKDGTGQAEIAILTVVYGIYGLADVFFYFVCLLKWHSVSFCRNRKYGC